MTIPIPKHKKRFFFFFYPKSIRILTQKVKNLKGVFGWEEFRKKERERKEIETKEVIFLCLVVEENARERLKNVKKVLAPTQNFFLPQWDRKSGGRIGVINNALLA